MKILITGGAGFIGHHLIKKFKNTCNPSYLNYSSPTGEKHKITSIDNYSTGIKSNHIENVEYIKMDAKNWNQKKDNLVDGYYDLCFHLGAMARIQPSFKNPRETIENNYMSTLNILDLCKKHNIPLVYAGSSSVHHNPFKSPYAYSKFAGEQLLELYNKLFNMNCVITRFYNVYGEKQISIGDYATVMGIFERQYYSNEPFTIVGDGNQKRDFTHVDDIVNGLKKAGQFIVDRKNNQKLNECYKFELGRSKNYSINFIAELFDKNHPIKYIKSRAGEYDSTLADYSLARDILNWEAKIDIKDYIQNLPSK